jgi:hypothetical protein
VNPSDEIRLILLCAGTKINDDKMADSYGLLNRHFNWEGIRQTSLHHDIAPLLYHGLKKIQKNQPVPHQVMDKLKQAYHANVARNMYLYAELDRILMRFKEEGVSVIILKGAALAQAVYGDIGLRSMGDIDLLVKREDLSAAQELMSDLGYVQSTSHCAEEWNAKKEHHLPIYSHPDKSVLVEVHWHISRHFLDNDIGDWWARAQVAKIGNCRALIPSPEDMLLHLCLHLFNHGYDQMTLRGYCDISEILRRYGMKIDWHQFRERVSKYKVHKPVYTILYFIKDLNGNYKKLLGWINPYYVDFKLLALIEKRLIKTDSIHSDILAELVQCVTEDSLRRKAMIILSHIFPARHKMSTRYPSLPNSWKIYFYYLIRPFQLVVKYGKHVREIFGIKKYSTED